MKRLNKMFLCGLTIVLLIVSAVPAIAANDLDKAQKNKKSIDSKLNDVKEQKKELQNKKEQLEKDKEYISKLKQSEEKEYEKLKNEIEIIEKDIEQIDLAIQQSEQELAQQQEDFKARLRAMYKNSNQSSLELLLESKSLTELYERIKYLSLIAKSDRERVEALKIAKKDVEYKKQLREGDKQRKAQEINAKQERIEELKVSSRSLEERLQKSQEELKKLEKLEDELLQESKDLANLIKELTKKQKQRKYSGGTMLWPLPSSQHIGSYFGMRVHPILKVKKMHTGVDIGGTKGKEIVAAADGTVILSGYSSGYGYRVVIDHGGGISTLYAHCSKLLVDVGDEVKRGDTIALVGSTGLSTGPHLHFEVRENGNPVDPLKGYLSK